MINEETILTLYTFTHSLSFYTTIVYWVLFFIGLTNHLGCGIIKGDNGIDFPRIPLIGLILSNICWVITSCVLGIFISSLQTMLTWLICIFGVIFTVFGMVCGELGMAFMSLLFGAPSMILFTILTSCRLFQINFELTWHEIVKVVTIGAIIAIVPVILLRIYIWIDDMIDDRRRKRAEAQDKAEFEQFVNEHGLNKSALGSELRASEIKELRGLANGYFAQQGRLAAKSFGPQFTDYLQNYGHLDCGDVKLCGIGENVEPEYDMIAQTKRFREKANGDNLGDYFVLRVIDENDYILIRDFNDKISRYNLEKNEFQRWDGVPAKTTGWEMTKLYDYVKILIQDAKT
jgi:hypothetical protein